MGAAAQAIGTGLSGRGTATALCPRRGGVSFLGVIALAALAGEAHAQAFTTRAAFNAALPGTAVINGFDGVAAGTTVASGAAAAGVTFTYDFGGQVLKVTAAYPAVSAGNALGTADADVLQDGDNLSISFPATNALGLYVITREALQNGDLSLSAGGHVASIAAIEVQQTLGDGYGNLCDADLNNSGLTTAADFNLFRTCINQSAGSSALCAAADMNGSGTVTAADFNLLRARLNTPPGPSGLSP